MGLSSYSFIKILSIVLGIASIGPTIVSLEKFMNEHGFNTLRTIQKNMKQQKEISNQLMSEMEQNDFVSLDDSSNENKLNDKQTQNIPTMNESESRSRYDSFYKLKKPK